MGAVAAMNSSSKKLETAAAHNAQLTGVAFDFPLSSLTRTDAPGSRFALDGKWNSDLGCHMTVDSLVERIKELQAPNHAAADQKAST